LWRETGDLGDGENETDGERHKKERKDINGGQKKHLNPPRKLQITTVTTGPIIHKITHQTSRNFQTFGSQSEIGSTFRHWTCSLLELGSLMAVMTPAHHLHFQGENHRISHRIRIRSRRHTACRFSSEHKSAGRMGCEHNPDMKCSKLDGKTFIQKQKNKGVCVCVCFAYADDVAILSKNKNALKDALGNTDSEARERGLLINENKTKYMELTRRVVNGNHLQCGKYEFEHVKELSYQGSQLNQTNSANCEIQTRTISGNR